ncbi:MAG: 50S ribosomal protein L11 methyltransferase [Peptococcaceae bacterium]|jgi:ribosomal protein L11 methyltransferase|nr:50S ribosomal protein L11 methyltransferase [Peptococcaceae bacterium]
MDWIEVSIYTTTEGIEPVCGCLYQLGFTGLQVEDAADFRAFLNDRDRNWDYMDDKLVREKQDAETCVKVYVSDREEGHAALRAVRDGMRALPGILPELDLGRLEVEVVPVREEDWANNWKQYFKPFPVGRRLMIKPSWESCETAEGRILLEIDPGSVFGTGLHETTQLCLEQLERYVKPDMSVLDVGCGSGILAAAACLFGAGRAVGVDMEPGAAETVARNAAGNGIPLERMRVYTGNILTDAGLRETLGQEGPFDLVLANIMADVIMEAAPWIPGWLKPGGVCLASGIIEERGPEVVRALESAGLALLDVVKKKDWLALAVGMSV